MRIVIDSAIPFIEGVFEPYCEVAYIGGSDITAEDVRDADALIIRTRTRCSESLLGGSRVRHIATATIGYDHIDMEYCRSRGITVTTAAGCNARGVLQWVAASLALLSQREGWHPRSKKLGVVGVGNVGSLIVEYAQRWGYEVVCCDPPRAQREGDGGFVSLEELLSEVDIVTLHTPLDSTTRHLINSRNIGLLRDGGALLNSSRGEVVETECLIKNPQYNIMLDVWEREPNIDQTLLGRAITSTPHIAGYSIQGKANGTAIVVGDIAQHFELPIMGWYPNIERNQGKEIGWEEMMLSMREYFDIAEQSLRLKQHPEEFEKMRNNYKYRSEQF